MSNLNKIYYRDAHIIIIMYDCTKANEASEQLEAWFKHISENVSGRTGKLDSSAEIMIVGTKKDLIKNEKRKEQLEIEEISKVIGL